jgi:hypothetical protein
VKDILVRAAKTFVQAFIATLAVANMTDNDSIKAAVIAAVAAGVSAVWNTLILANEARKSE